MKNAHVYAHLTKLCGRFLPRKKGYLGYHKGKIYLSLCTLHKLFQSVKFGSKNCYKLHRNMYCWMLNQCLALVY